MSKLTELKNARHSSRFVIVGKAKVRQDSLSGGKLNDAGTWLGVRDSFLINVGENRQVWASVSGGRSLSRGVLFKRSARDEQGNVENLQVPIEERFDESWMEMVSPDGKRYAELNEEDGRKVFLDDVDYSEYLQENLADETEVVVTGDVTYSKGKGDKWYRNYEVQNIYINKVDEKTGELKRKHDAFFEASYNFTLDSLPRTYMKDLQKEGKVKILGHHAHYLGQIPTDSGYVDFKKTAPVPQLITFKANKNDESELAKAKKILDKLFSIKRGDVREVIFNIQINDGVDEASGVEVLTPELKDLIEMGMMTLDDAKRKLTVRGARVNELVFNGVIPLVLGDKAMPWDDSRFAPEALVMPRVDSAPEQPKQTEVEEDIFSDDLLDGMQATSIDDLFAD